MNETNNTSGIISKVWSFCNTGIAHRNRGHQNIRGANSGRTSKYKLSMLGDILFKDLKRSHFNETKACLVQELENELFALEKLIIDPI